MIAEDVDVVGEEEVEHELDDDEVDEGETPSANDQKRPLRVEHILIRQPEAGGSKNDETLFGLSALGPADY